MNDISIFDRMPHFTKCSHSESPRTAPAATQNARPLAILQQPLLLPGESAEEFEELRAAIFAAKKPADVIEQIFAAEAAELTWEGFRDSRLATARFKARAFEKLNEKFGFRDEKAARRSWMQHPAAGKEMETRLSTYFGCTLDPRNYHTVRCN